MWIDEYWEEARLEGLQDTAPQTNLEIPGQPEFQAYLPLKDFRLNSKSAGDMFHHKNSNNRRVHSNAVAIL